MPVDTGSLLALGFGSPWLLLCAALAAIPSILHLLIRREHRAEPFAANRFLAEATRKHSRRLRFQHWLLLIEVVKRTNKIHKKSRIPIF